MARGSIPAGSKYVLITASGTTQVVTGPCTVGRIVISNVGTTATIDIHDATSGTTLKVYEWVSADTKREVDLNIRLTLGLRVIVSGTTPRAFITYDEG